MKALKFIREYFTAFEILLWLFSVTAIVLSFFLFSSDGILTLVSSLIGVSSLILCAKGNPLGQLLMIIFSVNYAIISYSFSYYGEMLTYLGMSGPMAFFSLVSWLKNPYNGKKSQVKVNRIGKRDIPLMIVFTLAVTVVFYFVLDFFNTANLIVSTFSVTTSFLAVYLTFRRSAYFALAYAANDIVLIILWVSASLSNTSYISVVVCFTVFLINDLYGFINWKKMEKKQK